ncbi:MAG: tetratricopeptide repeat protein [Planctomycetales bacterium]|nr:tetratricopeptide repeat protein [Planctomycetales bacterium]
MSSDASSHLFVVYLAYHLGLFDEARLIEFAGEWARQRETDSAPLAQWLAGRGEVTASMAEWLSQRGSELAAGEASLPPASPNPPAPPAGGDDETRELVDDDRGIGTIYGADEAPPPSAAGRLPATLPASLCDALLSADAKLWQGIRAFQATPRSDGQGAQGATVRSTRFQKVREYAQGGLGEVYVAVDDELHREVALKQIQKRFSTDEQARHQFMLEAEITGGLEHPGVVPVYGLGFYRDGDPYYAMRFVRGESMQAAIDTLHRRFTASNAQEANAPDRMFELRKLLGRVVDVCQAIGYAHSRGVLHRDIKPDNIMLGKYGETLVVDWGLAKVGAMPADVAREKPRPSGSATVSGEAAGSDDEVNLLETVYATASGDGPLRPESGAEPSSQGRIVGTLGFMSPEQAGGHDGAVDGRSDVFSIGATIYSLLAGQPALESRNAEGKSRPVHELLADIRRGAHRPLSTTAPFLPRPLIAICERAMSPQPNDRYASPLALADDLERWLSDEPVAAYPENLWERTRRWIKRNQTWAASLAAIVLVSSIALGAFSVVLRQKNERLVTLTNSLQEKNSALDRANHDLRIAEASARQEAAVANAVTEFMNDDLLSQASPGERPDPHLEVRTVLNAAADRVDSEFAEQPLVKARLMKTIGYALSQLGEYDKAERVLEQAMALFRASGETTRDMLVAQSALGAVHNSMGRHELGTPLLTEALEAQVKLLGEPHPDVSETLLELGWHAVSRGDFEQAEPLMDRAIRGNLQSLGPDHEETLWAESAKVGLYNQAGRPLAALNRAAELLPRARAALGDRHLLCLELQLMQAQSLTGLERSVEAVALYDKALAHAEAILPPAHPYILAIRSDRAMEQAEMGAPSESLATLQELHRQTNDLFGPDHRETIVSQSYVANTLFLLGRLNEAQDLFLEVLERAKQHLGPMHIVARDAMLSLAQCDYELGEVDSAARRLEPLLAERSGEAATSHAFALYLRATLHVDAEQYQLAEQLSRRARKLLKTDDSRNLSAARDVEHLLIWTLAAQDNFSAAEELLKEIAADTEGEQEQAALAMVKLELADAYLDSVDYEQTAGPLGERYRRALTLLQEAVAWIEGPPAGSTAKWSVMRSAAQLLSVTGQQQRAFELLDMAADGLESKFGLPHPENLSTHEVFWELLRDAAEEQPGDNRVAERAEQVLAKLVEGLRQSHGLANQRTLDAVEALATTQIERGEKEQAIATLRELRDGQAALNLPTTEVDFLTAGLHVDLNQFAEAIPIYREALDALGLAEGEESAEQLLAMHQLAWSHQRLKQFEPAVPIFERVVRRRTELFGEGSPVTLVSLANLASIRSQQGSEEAARLVLEDLDRRLRSRLDEADAEPLEEQAVTAAYVLAESYQRLRQLEPAIFWYRQVAQLRAGLLGGDDEDTLLAMHQVGFAQSQAGQLEEALSTYREVLKRREERLGRTHDFTRRTLSNVAQIELRREQNDDAKAMFEDLLARTIEEKGEGAPEVMDPLIGLGTSHARLGELEQAIRRYRESLDIAYRVLPKNFDNPQLSSQIAELEVALADVESRDQRLEDAWAHVETAVKTLNKYKAETWSNSRAKLVQGRVLVARGQHAEAVPLLEAAYVGLRAAEIEPESVHLRFQHDAAELLATAYEQLGSDKAGRWRKTAEALAAPK